MLDLGGNPEDWFSLVAAHMYWHKKTHTIVVPYFMALAGIYGKHLLVCVYLAGKCNH